MNPIQIRIFSLILMSVMAFTVRSAPGPRTYIQSIWAYGENVTDSLKLDYKQNNLRFFCNSGPDLGIDSLSFRFRLEGYDKTWVTPFKEGWYFYTDLPPGDYVFKAQSRIKDGEWGPVAEHAFSIICPWWRSWWAYLLYSLLTLTIILYMAYLAKTKLRIHNELVQERNNRRFRTQFVIQATREIRSPLTVIRSTVEKLKYPSGDRLSRTDIQHLRNSSEMLMRMVENLADFKELDHDISEITKDDISEMADVPINKGISVLIIEPEKQLADVIRRAISKFMSPVLCDSCREAEDILSEKPDAIIIDTDYDPSCSYNLVGRLKSDPILVSIPIILISDFHDSRNLLKAVRSDADDFLTKPFNCEVLAALTLKKIRASKSIQATVDKKEPQPTLLEKRADKLFLENIDRIIGANLSDAEFDINTLAEKLKISRGHLYNKIKDLKGYSPAEYLREARLSKAAAMLKESNLSVKEIRCMVGMPDPNNFNRRFKEKYNTSPSEFR